MAEEIAECRHRYRSVRAAMACICLGLVGASPGSDLRRVVDREVAAGFSGVVLVARGGDKLVDGAFGAMGGRRVQTGTPFWIASVGKQFVSAAILRCQEKRLLTLDDTLADRIESIPTDKRAITIRQLLTHTSGLGQSYAGEGQPDRPSALRAILAEQLAGPPGSSFRYSNSNYLLAAAVVEIVSGRDYQAFVREELWTPLGLRDTGFAGDAGANRVAPAKLALPARLAAVSWGSESVYSTADDLSRWLSALRARRVLDAASVDALFRGGPRIQEGQAALGWFVGRTSSGVQRVFTRGNEDFGANATVYFYPEREITIIVLTHAGDAPDDRSWSRRVHDALERALSL